MSRRPWILSPWFLPTVSTVLTLGLAVLCFWQWQRESSLTSELRQSRQALAAAESKAKDETNRADAATARHLETLARIEELNRVRQTDQAELEKLRRVDAERDALATAFEEAKSRIQQANDTIAKANENSKTASESITRLAAERDDLARRLNDRTEAYNALVKRLEGEGR